MRDDFDLRFSLDCADERIDDLKHVIRLISVEEVGGKRVVSIPDLQAFLRAYDAAGPY